VGPDFIANSALLTRAFRFASAAHSGSRSRGDTTIAHPVEVARLVRAHASDELVAAALLHDVLEDTTVTRDELEEEFGADIARLVGELSEDETIEEYAERKARLRAQVVAAGRDAALIFLADKLATLTAEGAGGAEPIEPARLAHYRETLESLSGSYPDLPFIADVRHALRNAPRRADPA
jgi:(p)ppGpp synthase/HD superfamily hydrolase